MGAVFRNTLIVSEASQQDEATRVPNKGDEKGTYLEVISETIKKTGNL